MDFSKINLDEHRDLAREIVGQAVLQTFKNREDFQKFRNRIIKARRGRIFDNLYFVKAYEEMLREGAIKARPEFARLIRKRSVRTMSGVAPVTVMTKAFPCPGRCVYCPTDVRMPKSYLASQPAAQRGLRQKFDPYKQVMVRLQALKATGHEVSKVELRIIGGTWSSYPKRYQKWFVKRCLQAMNEFPQAGEKENEQNILKRSPGKILEKKFERSPSLQRFGPGAGTFEKIVKKNETALIRCIGINIETRPDFVTAREIARLRELGVTKVEIGVQTTFDEVQRRTKRGHDLGAVRRATALLKDAGFKISYHMMPNLPGATPEMDQTMMRELFSNPAYQPDYVKIYPCVVVPGTELAEDFRSGKFQPYADEVLKDILKQNLRDIPEYCRVDRLARDIPADELIGGFKISNIRQIVEEDLRKEDRKILPDQAVPEKKSSGKSERVISPIREIRAREIMDAPFAAEDVELIVRSYEASGGIEHFLSFEDVRQDKLIALLRLRFPAGSIVPGNVHVNFLPEIKGAALIREVHVYGRQIAVGEKGREQKQHVGWGGRLMKEAERMAHKAGYKKIAVIAGIGTREYYRKLGYQLQGSYMVKKIPHSSQGAFTSLMRKS